MVLWAGDSGLPEILIILAGPTQLQAADQTPAISQPAMLSHLVLDPLGWVHISYLLCPPLLPSSVSEGLLCLQLLALTMELSGAVSSEGGAQLALWRPLSTTLTQWPLSGPSPDQDQSTL